MASPFSVLSHNDSFLLDSASVLAFIKRQLARYHRIRIDSCFKFMQVRSHDVQSARSVFGRCRCMHLGEFISGHSLPSDWILPGRMIFLAHAKMLVLLFFPFFLHADESSLYLQVCSWAAAIWRRPAASYCCRSSGWSFVQFRYAGPHAMCARRFSAAARAHKFFAHYIDRPVSEKKYAYLFVCYIIFCSAVGIYNDTSATEYCMKVRDTSLTGPMFPENKQTR